MQIVIIFGTSMLVAALATFFRLRQAPSLVELAISAISTALTLAIAYTSESAGTKWSIGISLFLVVALTLGFGALARRPLAKQ